MSDMPLILAGLLVGAAHVLVGPDHLAAMAPFAIEAHRKAWKVGLRWGVGHALGIIVVGLAGYALIDWLDLEFPSGVSERLIGVVLIAISVWGFLHLHRTRTSHLDPAPEQKMGTHVHTRAAFLVGAVHGVAGTGNVLGVLPAMAQSSWLNTGMYLVSFALGSVLGMMGFAHVLGVATPGETPKSLAAYRRVFIAACGVCLAVGLLWLVFPGLGLELDWGP